MSPMTTNYKPSIKQLVRWLAPTSNRMFYHSTEAEVSAEISSLILQGFRVQSTHFLGVRMEPTINVEAFGVLYILTLEQSEVEKLRRMKDTEKEG